MERNQRNTENRGIRQRPDQVIQSRPVLSTSNLEIESDPEVHALPMNSIYIRAEFQLRMLYSRNYIAVYTAVLFVILFIIILLM